MGAVNFDRTAVYRFYDSTGRLLYVGMAGSFRARWLAHRRTQPWWPQVDQARTSVDWYDTRQDAAAAEALAIREERPIHNIHGTPRHGASLIRRPDLAVFGSHRFLGAAEIAGGLAVSRQRTQQLVNQPDFPPPFAVLAMGKVWRREDVERWARERATRLAGDPTEL